MRSDIEYLEADDRVGVTFGAFDLLHAGHVKMLQDARRECEFLIVGLQVDPSFDRPATKNRPVQTLVERWIQLAGQGTVDMIVPYQTEAEVIEILKAFRVDVRIIGEDYLDRPFTGKDVCEKLGIKVIYNRRRHDYSTTNLRNRVAEAQKK